MDGLDMGAFVAPKSDQLTADDLMKGPRTIQIVRVSGTDSPEQPVSIHFEGDDGKPFKPCKLMRRVMVAAWGRNAAQYAGRSMRLYRDGKVKFGGMEVGGIRISHMSHIDKRVELGLLVAKGKMAPYRVEPLAETKPQPDDSKIEAGAEAIIAQITAAETMDALGEVLKASAKQRAWLEKERPTLHARIDAALRDRHAALSDDFPGTVSNRDGSEAGGE